MVVHADRLEVPAVAVNVRKFGLFRRSHLNGILDRTRRRPTAGKCGKLAHSGPERQEKKAITGSAVVTIDTAQSLTNPKVRELAQEGVPTTGACWYDIRIEKNGERRAKKKTGLR
jgi:hypothetical protein